MRLAKAANYFVKTSVSGWDGENWVDNIAKIALLPSDRFISVHEFDTHNQYALTPVESTGLDKYAVIKFTTSDQVFLVGMETEDVQGDPYSKFYLLRKVKEQGEVFKFTKVFAASGTAKGVTRTSVGKIYADVEYVTSVSSKTTTESRFSEATLYLPRDTVIESDFEIKLGTSFWDVRDVRKNSGLITCRALRKQSA